MTTLVRVSILTDTGLPEDEIENNWVIGGLTSASASGDIDDVVAAFGAFYTAVDTYYAHTINTNSASQVSLYDITAHLDGSPHGSPYRVDDLNAFGSIASDAMPHEVSACLTLEAVGRAAAAVESGVTRPKQRLTGRVYLGPLGTAAGAESGGAFRLAGGFVTAILDAVEDLDNALEAVDGSYGLQVWSRAAASAEYLEAASVDNAFDIQRRRGEAPSQRTRRSLL